MRFSDFKELNLSHRKVLLFAFCAHDYAAILTERSFAILLTISVSVSDFPFKDSSN